MFKRILAFLLLLNHLNTAMFLPQLQEVDMFDSAGNQVDDINTLVEFIDQEVMGNYDNTPEDEDDDTEKPLHISKVINASWHPYVKELNTKLAATTQPEKVFTGYIDPSPIKGFHKILIQPPKV